MGCRLSSYAKPETVNEADQDNASGAQQHQNSSVEQGDYVDGVDISHVSNIRVTLYGNSSELNVYAYTTSIEDPTIVFRGAYHVIIEKLKMCLKRKRKFIFYIWLFDECVWSPPSVNAMANLFLNTLPAIKDLVLCGCLTNMNVQFIDFYRKLHPIVECLLINNPTIVRFLIDLQLKSLTVVSNLDFIRRFELFTHTRTLFGTFERMMNWNQGKLNTTIVYKVFYNGQVNKELARRMTVYIGYKCSYENAFVRLEASMSNVNLIMEVHNK
ncbi:unnamed protein product [Bursaphelenchus okinawaensis]|uniref:Uncharacterized protein n=1 Tax=Bursaphelenchus okinawaensis TaxID=465554 RepID=A0A811LTU5_9BILA|nr:unnamed protein product [Bursaphelenchus okinawaensis]CAG9127767.1 unnamed protein product [Bursaphelenchus okinawaensis]